MKLKKLKRAFKYIDEKSSKLHYTTCSKGCNHCCYMPVMLSLTEAKYIVEQFGFPKDLELLKKQASKDFFKIIPEDYYKLPLQDRKCVYLINGECSIYPIRPITCRGYFSTSKPENCSTLNNKKAETIIVGAIRMIDIGEARLLPVHLWNLYTGDQK